MGDRGLVAAFYGWGGLTDGQTLRSTEAWTGRTGADAADYKILDGADWGRRGGLGRTGTDGGILDRAWRGVRGGLGNLGRA